MSKKKKTVIAIIIVVLAVGAAGIFVLDKMAEALFCNNSHSKNVMRFYEEPEDSLDGVYIGSSAAYRYWNAPMAYEDYGMTVYGLSTYIQPITLPEYFLKEAEKSQDNLKFAIVELRNLARPSVAYNDNNFKLVSDAMPYSKNRYDAIEAYHEYCSEISADIDYTTLDYHFPILRRNGKWIFDYEWGDYRNYKNTESRSYKGFYPAEYSAQPLEDTGEITAREPLEKADRKLLKSLADTAEEMYFDVIFVSSPAMQNEFRTGILNSACDYMEERGFNVLNFNVEPLRSDIDMDWSSDFYDERHVVAQGSTRYTKYLSRYLAEHYELEDHRNQEGFESWDEAVKKMKEAIR